jgi:hypothetical protein
MLLVLLVVIVVVNLHFYICNDFADRSKLLHFNLSLLIQLIQALVLVGLVI